MPGRDKLPSTLKRSPAKAQRTWIKTHDKKGDRWVPKARKGPSDPQAKKGGRAARKGRRGTFGGVDYEGHTKQELARAIARAQ